MHVYKQQLGYTVTHSTTGHAHKCRPTTNHYILRFPEFVSYGNVVNSRITGPNLAKFLRNIEKSFPFNPLKSE